MIFLKHIKGQVFKLKITMRSLYFSLFNKKRSYLQLHIYMYISKKRHNYFAQLTAYGRRSMMTLCWEDGIFYYDIDKLGGEPLYGKKIL